MIVNAVPESIRYDIYNSYIASAITTIVMIIVSLIAVSIFKKRTIPELDKN